MVDRRRQYRSVPAGRDASADLAAALQSWQRQTRHPVRRPERSRLWWRHRRQLLPWLVAATVVLLAVAANTVGPMIFGHDGAVVVVSLAGGAAVVAGGVLSWRRMSPYWRVRAGVGAVAAVSWLPWAAEALSWTKYAVILPVFLLLKARHDREKRMPTPTSKPDGRHEPTTVEERWAARVGEEGFALPGSSIGNRRVEENHHAKTEVYDGWLVGGKQTVASAQAQMPFIASGLGGEVQRYLLDHHPTAGDSSRFVFKVIERGPVTQPVYYSGPRHRDGLVELGPYNDGEGYAAGALYRDNRMKNWMVIGETGIGKSRVLETIALGARASGNTVVVFFDGDSGMSSPTLMRYAWRFVPLDGAEAGRLALSEIETYRRKMLLDQGGTSGFNPSAAMPGLLCIKDEVHRMYNRQTVPGWANLAREANKKGIAQCDSDQDGSLDTFISSVLRDSLQSGTTIGMHVTSRDAGAILSDSSGFNCADLPAVPGFSHILNPRQGLDQRRAPFRNEWLPDQKDRESGKVPVEIATVEEWFPRVPGIEPEDEVTRIWDSHLSGAGTPELMTADTVGADAVVFPDALVIERPELSVRDEVWAAVMDGIVQTRDIVERTGRSDKAVRLALDELAGDGRLERLGKTGRVRALVAAGVLSGEGAANDSIALVI